MSYKHEDLHVFQSADSLVHLIFDTTSTFPKGEEYITANQIKRASLSIVLNIVEGNAKRIVSTNEFLRFLKIAYGSLVETEYLIEFCFKRNYLNSENYSLFPVISQTFSASSHILQGQTAILVRQNLA